ncbi:MAG TPA: exonuclease, partial [Desulfobacteraceae bacterium]|nr:exonuclease [Desulfobacteraceae bacterium]
LGRRLEELGSLKGEDGDAAPEVKILGKSYPLHASVEKIGGFSAHADRHELMRVITESNLRVNRVAVVHGEASQSEALARRLNEKGLSTVVPQPGDRISL